MNQIAPPTDMPADQWFVAELRRTATLLQLENQMNMLEMLRGIGGLILGFGAIFMAVYLVNRWNTGPRKTLLARLARWQLQKWTPPSD